MEGINTMANKKIIVQIDPDLKELIPDFLVSKQQDVIKLKQALEEQDFEQISFIGHKLRGAGGGYGFDKISTLGATMESLAEKSDPDSELAGVLNEFEEYLNSVEVVFEPRN